MTGHFINFMSQLIHPERCLYIIVHDQNSIPTPPEGELLALVAEGNEPAFRRLVDRYWAKVYGNTMALVKSAPVAEELTQDIFLKIWKGREKLGQVENFRTYIFVVGRHQVISAMRRKMDPSPSGEPDDDALELRLVPDRQLELKETEAVIREAVAKLTPKQKLVFEMSRMEGLTHEQIATRLGLSKETVKGHMVLALNFLRNYLSNHPEKALFWLFIGFF